MNVGLGCFQESGMTEDDLMGLANVAWDTHSTRWQEIAEIYNSDSINIGDYTASGRIFLMYCSIMFGRHPLAIGDNIKLREEKRRYFHKLLCASANTTHDDEEFKTLLEKRVEEFVGKYRPHELAIYKKKMV
jgi:hypothetical protein